MAGMIIESRSIDWYSVHEFVFPTLNEVGSWPLVGSLPWRELSDDDPAKIAAVLDAGRHHALRIETAQAALAEASQTISAAADWPAIARSIRRRHNSTYIPRRTA
ncbi:DUF2742 domain-containing protein [Mycobacterium marinum]|uniref:DUF2742 domain-containing protein n=1 Tax=Mycobacterium marinum TaxID=1781 RepID=UPI00235913F6|nr:DUF2742 domain-containing protein [Mycobacterium marinum]MDC8973987.1 DUF2742 domain-containing protein [Mycobacterium marinum]